MTAIGWIIVLALICLFATVIIRLAPVYIEYFTIRTAIASVAKDSANKSTNELYNEMERRFEVNNVNIISPHDVKIARQGMHRALILNYDDRVPFLANIDFLVKFHRSFNIGRD
jgi:hypothetical protein